MSNAYELRKNSDLSQRLSPQSLLRHYANTYSECGQDGILSYIFRTCGIHTGLFVEFGAWDGVHLSNCRALTLRGWRGLSVECDPQRHAELERNLPHGSIAVNARIGTRDGAVSGTPIDTVLTDQGVKVADVTFLSIDVDGHDLEIFEDLSFCPPVVLVEGGFNYNPCINDKVPFEYAGRNNQHPLGAVVSSARAKGYEAVCFFQDTYLVRSDYAHFFGEQIALGAKGLYLDAWSFASDTLRDYLLQFRQNDVRLQEIEVNALGFFRADPTAVDGIEA